ncbi:E3 ubiquitin-protein ligase RNF220-like protein [Leptotrombidium deliense]|uniref:E3 ubiquitin-protein ligase RNF220-like protein n=1 Tax=Leptotrombidium deliense TaxID=299467 RepID=A0A443S3Z4_9ACAR|nr:E3 ubiquitin-protein ligase RNF220-like protein [Leptotrombidium deliense]
MSSDSVEQRDFDEEYEWAGIVKLRTSYEEAKAFAGPSLVKVSNQDNADIVDIEHYSDFGDEQYSEMDLHIDSDQLITIEEIDRAEDRSNLDITQNKNSFPTCSVCLEVLHTPLVSTACWHILCEKCWIRCLQVKKLCPKCNSIVLPSNLRKVYF